MPADPRIIATGGGGSFNSTTASAVVPPPPVEITPYAVLVWFVNGTGIGGAGSVNFTDANGSNRGFSSAFGLFASGLDNPGQPYGAGQPFWLRDPNIALGGTINAIHGVSGANMGIAWCLVDPFINAPVVEHLFEGNRDSLASMNYPPYGPPADPGLQPMVAFYANYGGHVPVTNAGGSAWTLQTVFHQSPAFGFPGTAIAVSTYQAIDGVPFTPPAWQIDPLDPEIWAGATLSFSGPAVLVRSAKGRSSVQFVGG